MCDCNIPIDDINKSIQDTFLLKKKMEKGEITGDYILFFCDFCNGQFEEDYARTCKKCNKDICRDCDNISGLNWNSK